MNGHSKVERSLSDHLGDMAWLITRRDFLKASGLVIRDLASTSGPAIVFIHQQLDGKGSNYVKNAADVRKILRKSRRVLAVFQGHNRAGHYSNIEGIHYYTLKAMIEGAGQGNSSYAVVEIHDNRDIAVTGYRRGAGKKLKRESADGESDR